jgi:hypothetical protein
MPQPSVKGLTEFHPAKGRIEMAMRVCAHMCDGGWIQVSTSVCGLCVYLCTVSRESILGKCNYMSKSIW